jgi:hypothetical protein
LWFTRGEALLKPQFLGKTPIAPGAHPPVSRPLSLLPAAAKSKVANAEAEVDQADTALKPVKAKADAADKTAQAAEDEADRIRGELEGERTEAAQEIAAAESDYEDEQSAHDTTTAVGLGVAGLALLVAIGALVFSRVGKWPLSKRATQASAAGLGVLLVAGLGVALVPSSPEAPGFSDETLELAADAKGDPADPPSAELVKAEEAAAPLVAKAQPADEKRDEAERVLAKAESKLNKANSELSNAKGKTASARADVEKQEREEAKEAAFRDEATAIDYDQLIKNPYRYVGDKVVYTGQIFQIQEGFGGFMLLSVTDEGFDFWTDEIYVTGFGHIESAEEDIITVYGIVKGAKEYDTQSGGTNYVPRIKAKYVDE